MLFFAAMRSTRGLVIVLEAINCSSVLAAGSVRFSPPSLVGSANRHLSESLGTSLPASFGIKRLLIACSREVRSSPIFGVVLAR